jgi:Sigma-70, region 4
MTTRPWYPIRCPITQRRTMQRGNRAVEVIWGPWQGVAVLLTKPIRETLTWAEPSADNRNFRDLPPTHARTYRDRSAGDVTQIGDAYLDARGWGYEPDCWRPREGETWPDPLPAPLHFTPAHINGVSVSIDRMSQRLTAEAAADLAAEMQRERDFLSGRGDEAVREALPWWRETGAVSFEPFQTLTRREAEGRVMRALYFLGGRGGDSLGVRTNAAVMADLAHAASLLTGYATSDYVPHLTLTPADRAEGMLQAMRWVTELDLQGNGSKRRYVLEMRSGNMPRTYREIGEQLSVTAPRAKQLEQSALDRIHEIAMTGTPIMDATLARIQQENRDHANAIAA